MPFGLGLQAKDRSFTVISNIFDSLMHELSCFLNDYHHVNHDVRYWRILLGHWLHKYICVIYNRWHTLEQAYKSYEIIGTTAIDTEAYHLATEDSASFIRACDDDIWNSVLYARILSHMNNPNSDIVESVFTGIQNFTLTEKKAGSVVFKFKCVAKNIAEYLQKFGRSSNAFIFNSYLPKNVEIKLQLALGQIPQFWKSPNVIKADIDSSLRKELSLSSGIYSGFDECASKLLFEMLPICYLEGYKSLVKQVSVLPWPNNPRFIFTSNNFDTDEVFKAWAGNKVEQGVPYYTGQHGNNYGTLKYCLSEIELIETSDKFITWGWSDDASNVVPAFIFKMASEKSTEFDPKGKLLLIESYAPHNNKPWDSYYEHKIYQDEQFRFVSFLHDHPRQELVVRLHRDYESHNWSDKDRWEDFDSKIKIDPGTNNINSSIEKSRLVVHSYDSTGILETLSQNIPTLAFWQNDFDHLRISAKPYYQLLINVGIVHLSPESIAEKVNEVWDDVEDWWLQRDVQDAREKFCEQYARTSSKPTSDMKEILNTCL